LSDPARKSAANDVLGRQSLAPRGSVGRSSAAGHCLNKLKRATLVVTASCHRSTPRQGQKLDAATCAILTNARRAVRYYVGTKPRGAGEEPPARRSGTDALARAMRRTRRLTWKAKGPWQVPVGSLESGPASMFESAVDQSCQVPLSRPGLSPPRRRFADPVCLILQEGTVPGRVTVGAM
jgi:hypothetical protein